MLKMTLFESFLSTEVHQIVFLQANLKRFQWLLLGISTFLSPHNITEYWVPLLGMFNYELLSDLMIVTTASDFIGYYLKWINPECRPFWWVQETQIYGKGLRPELRQHMITCETTSGNPSGHSMAATTFFCVLGEKFIEFMNRESDYNPKFVKFFAYVVILGLSVAMWISRLYFAAHFLHQCITGSAIGFFICRTFYNCPKIQDTVYYADKKKAITFASICGLATTALYGSLLFLNIDPMWTVRMAFKWCEDPQYLRPESTPVFCMIKGLALVLGIACSAPLGQIKNKNLDFLKIVPCVIFTVLLHSFSYRFVPKHQGRLYFLGFIFVQNALYAFTLMFAIPKLCTKPQSIKVD